MRHGGRIPYLYHFRRGERTALPCKEVMEEKNMKKATIRDVAKAAGVSQSTVSRVLNNNGYVGEDARRRVEEAMEALHYSPSAIAVCLSKSRSRMIGVIVPQIFAPFFSRMYYIADRIMERYGYRLLLCNSDESLKREKSSLTICFRIRSPRCSSCPWMATRAATRSISTTSAAQARPLCA